MMGLSRNVGRVVLPSAWVSESTAWRWIRADAFSASNVVGSWLITGDDLDAVLHSNPNR